MQGCKLCKTPLPSSLKVMAYGSPPFENPNLYRSVVGNLQYITVIRPKLAYHVNRVCQFMHNPLQEHWKGLRGYFGTETSHFGLHIQKSSDQRLTEYSDFDWGSEPGDRKSASGFCVPNLISWSLRKQHAVSRSSTKTDYRSVASLSRFHCKLLLW